MASFFVESSRLATTDLVEDLESLVEREFAMTVPLSPQVSFQQIVGILDNGTALWLDNECVLVEAYSLCGGYYHIRYYIKVNPWPNSAHLRIYQVPGTTEREAPLPALEYFIGRLTNDDGVRSFSIEPNNFDRDRYEAPGTLDVSPAFFSNLLQTSRLHDDGDCSVTLYQISLTAEQTMMLFTHDTGPVFITLTKCHFHGPTLLQLGSAALQREQTPLLGRDSYLTIELDDEQIHCIPLDVLTVLLSNPHLRYFRPFPVYLKSYIADETAKKLASALAANQISRLLSLDLHIDAGDEPSMWIDLWKTIEHDPSLKEVHIMEPSACRQNCWWQPIAAAVKANPRLVHVGMCVRINDSDSYEDDQALLDEQVEALLERNRHRPKIDSLCCTDPSRAAVLLGQAIVAVSCMKNAKCRREIHQMLLEQLVLTGYDFGVGVGLVLGKKRPLAETDVVVLPNDVLATKTELFVVDCVTTPPTNQDSK